MNLPQKERTFEYKEKGELTLKEYAGSFTVKSILSMLDKRILEIEKSRLRVDVSNPSYELEAITTILANLKVRIIKAPSWWEESNNGNDMVDENVIVTLFDKVMEQEDLWRKELQELSGNTEGN